MDDYLQAYDTYDRTIVYSFELGVGGIGDLTKFFMILLLMCMEHKIKLKYCVHGTVVEHYLKLRHEKMYIHRDEFHTSEQITHVDDITKTTPGIIYTVAPQLLYTSIYILNTKSIPFSSVFMFSDEILSEDDEYVSIHLRLGDKFLETDPAFIQCKEDERSFDEAALFRCIEQCPHKIMFFCDNRSYKEKVKTLYPKITITDYDIGHTSHTNTTEIQVRNTIREFYLLSKSTRIYMGSYSGFPVMAGKMNMIPVETIQ
jgi:hypothetical protein